MLPLARCREARTRNTDSYTPFEVRMLSALPRERLSSTPMLEVRTLTDGGQTAVAVAREIAGFLREATATLELALYDLKLGPESAQIVLPALTELAAKGVAVRVV